MPNQPHHERPDYDGELHRKWGQPWPPEQSPEPDAKSDTPPQEQPQ